MAGPNFIGTSLEAVKWLLLVMLQTLTYFLLRGSLLTVSTISRVVVIHLNQPYAAGTDVNFFLFFF
jgi:hypothetical protein